MSKFDLHIHTEATAPYLKGDSQLEPYHIRGREAGLDFMGISDHYHYFWQKTRYLSNQRKHLVEALYNNPNVYLGVEQTILSKSGRIGIKKSGLRELDYIILSVHWMPYGDRLRPSDLKGILSHPNKLEKLIRLAENYYLNAIKNQHIANLPKIIGHPYHFLIEHQIFPKSLLSAIDNVLKACADLNVAFELNAGMIPREFAALKSTNPQAFEFWSDVFALIKEMKVPLSMGSDAHKLQNIGNVDNIINCLDYFKVNYDLLISESFLKHEIQ